MATQPGIETAMEAQPGQPQSQQQQIAHKRLQQQHAEVAAVTEIMRHNVEKIIDKDQKLSDLDCRAEILVEEAAEFDKHAKTLNRKFWWKNCKMLAILIGIGLVIIVVIVGSPIDCSHCGESFTTRFFYTAGRSNYHC